MGRRYSKKEKQEMVEATKHASIAAVAAKFKVSRSTLEGWRREFGILPLRHSQLKCSKAQVRKALALARVKGVVTAAKKYDLTVDTLYRWRRWFGKQGEQLFLVDATGAGIQQHPPVERVVAVSKAPNPNEAYDVVDITPRGPGRRGKVAHPGPTTNARACAPQTAGVPSTGRQYSYEDFQRILKENERLRGVIIRLEFQLDAVLVD